MKIEEFDIEFVKFKNDTHELNFHLGNDFFRLFENSSFDTGNIAAKVIFEKSNVALRFDFTIMGSLNLSCDRCLNRISFPVENEFTLHVKITDHPGEEEDNLAFILPSEHKINIASYIYEIIYLALPMRRICEDIGEQCDVDVISKLKKISVESNESNIETENPDPEWDKLKDLFKDKK